MEVCYELDRVKNGMDLKNMLDKLDLVEFYSLNNDTNGLMRYKKGNLEIKVTFNKPEVRVIIIRNNRVLRNLLIYFTNEYH